MTYVSSAKDLMSVSQLAQLLERVREKNEKLGLTGMLLYSGGNIIQVLEGPEHAVREVFAAITTDRRHTDVVTLWEEEIDDRAFPDWSMGFRDVGDHGLADMDGFTSYLQRRDDRDLGRTHEPDPVSILLGVFRDTMR